MRIPGNSFTIETPDGLELAAASHAADGDPRGTVLLAHGITQDMTEGGMYDRLAACLTDASFDVVRFSFRGHGDSDGHPEGVTIAGECLDFESAFEYVRANYEGPYFVVAKSFGAVSTCLSLEPYEDDLAGLVLWNPVLDIAGTFLEPTAAWGQEHFTGEALEGLRETGRLEIRDGFAIGRVLYEEFEHYDPGARFVTSDVPALVIHGDTDEIVPYEETRRVARAKGVDFHTIEDGNHGFVTPESRSAGPMEPREHDETTVEWITAHVAE